MSRIYFICHHPFQNINSSGRRNSIANPQERIHHHPTNHKVINENNLSQMSRFEAMIVGKKYEIFKIYSLKDQALNKFFSFEKYYRNKATISSPVVFTSASGSIHKMAAFWNTYIAQAKQNKNIQYIVSYNISDHSCFLVHTMITEVLSQIIVPLKLPSKFCLTQNTGVCSEQKQMTQIHDTTSVSNYLLASDIMYIIVLFA